MRLLPAAARKATPWKNGGGETFEIAARPAGADLASFGWRVSVARVAGNGPFSLFPGVDRTLAVLRGEGIVLSLKGEAPVALTPGAPPFRFPADRPADARLLGGVVTDLNAMTARGRYRHRMRDLDGATVADARWTLVVAAAVARVRVADQTVDLAPFDALLLEEKTTLAPLPNSGRMLVIGVDVGEESLA